MAYENNDKKMESVYSQRIRAGKRRTYFFDVRETRGNDFYLTITESRKKFNEDGYDRHKIFLYKEDFNKFLKGMTEAIDFVKTELMPDFDFDAFNHEGNEPYDGQGYTPGKEAIANDASNDASADADEAPTGIAAAATPEIDSVPTAPAAEPETPASDSEDAATEQPLDTSHRDEEVDKW
ncbi:MAG: DUF3276 family protein [Ginsengibacter sp.]